MQYPGHLIGVGEPDGKLVEELADRLRARGYHVRSPDGVYDDGLASLVSLFQAQNVDRSGRPLHVDSVVGPLTWGALFMTSVPADPPTGPAAAALGVAVSQIGVMEDPPGSNRGPMVSTYLKAAGCSPGEPWCMSFVYWCFETAADGRTAFPRSGTCLDVWDRVVRDEPARIIPAADALADPSIVKAGHVFVLDHGNDHGHTGFVRQSLGGPLRTVEGNTNNNGTSEGLGVFELTRRNVADPQLKGFLDFSS